MRFDEDDEDAYSVNPQAPAGNSGCFPQRPAGIRAQKETPVTRTSAPGLG